MEYWEALGGVFLKYWAVTSKMCQMWLSLVLCYVIYYIWIDWKTSLLFSIAILCAPLWFCILSLHCLIVFGTATAYSCFNFSSNFVRTSWFQNTDIFLPHTHQHINLGFYPTIFVGFFTIVKRCFCWGCYKSSTWHGGMVFNSWTRSVLKIWFLGLISCRGSCIGYHPVVQFHQIVPPVR